MNPGDKEFWLLYGVALGLAVAALMWLVVEGGEPRGPRVVIVEAKRDGY